MELEKAYDHSKVENKIYRQWLDAGYFNPDSLPDAENRKPYAIIMPPPNVTGTLHMGHALMVTIEDILVRFQRMLGKKTLWLPGTDHAAIATQSKVEKLLEKEEGKRKYDLGREEFLKRVSQFAQDSHDTIVNQLKAMGASCDWSREAFTLDEQRNLAVRTAFKQMFDWGLIYRGQRVINWDVKGQTTISDDEVVYVERPAKLYTFRYSKDFPIPISTTRPETKLGDTAVAVHPADERYRQYIGKEYDLVFCGSPLHVKVVADESADKEFGTGAVGVTPAHSMTDYEIAQRHNLPLKQIIDERGKMTVGTEAVLGQKAEAARQAVVEWLKAENLLEKEEDIVQNVATAERTGGIIEPLPKLQWFIAVNREFPLPHSELAGIKQGEPVSLKRLMRHAVESGQIKIFPEHFAKIYFHWIENLRDWCISRQIWYGHRIPVYYCKQALPHSPVSSENPQPPAPNLKPGCRQPIAAIENMQACPYCGGPVEQDNDTLDTWFSSGLWTFSTLGWPDKTPDLATFHPTDVMETGYDILFFWVARMILMTTALTGQVPFRSVFLHGIVRDATRQKMSKSKGNVIDPLDMSAKYGTDAVRFALVFNTAPGTDMAMAEDKIKGMKHFANKLWNISRFVLSSLGDFKPDALRLPANAATEVDRDILAKLGATVRSATKNIDNFQLHLAAQDIYQFTWHELADIYIEESKKQLADEALKENTLAILLYCLVIVLKLLHPFMPFLTEELWSKLKEAGLLQKDGLLMVSQWPN